MTHEERKLYGEAILNTLSNDSNINSTFCSSLCESKKHVKSSNPNEGIDPLSLQLSDGGEFISKELEKYQEETE